MMNMKDLYNEFSKSENGIYEAMIGKRKFPCPPIYNVVEENLIQYKEREGLKNIADNVADMRFLN